MPEPLIAFAVTGFKGHYPVGTAAIVWAEDREQCKRVLRAKLLEQRLGGDSPDEWTISPLTPCPSEPRAAILLDGNY